MTTWKGEKEYIERGNRERGAREGRDKRPERSRTSKQLFYSRLGYLATEGWGKPGCSQVTVGVESSQKARGLGTWPYIIDGHRIIALRSQQCGNMAHGFCPL